MLRVEQKPCHVQAFSVERFSSPNADLAPGFEAHGPFTIPAYFLLDAGSPNALAFFSAIDFKEIYHAVLGMLLSWLHFEFPKQYPLSAARYHQAQTIPLLRERLAQGQHNDETYVIMLCAMQTDVR